MGNPIKIPNFTVHPTFFPKHHACDGEVLEILETPFFEIVEWFEEQQLLQDFE